MAKKRKIEEAVHFLKVDRGQPHDSAIWETKKLLVVVAGKTITMPSSKMKVRFSIEPTGEAVLRPRVGYYRAGFLSKALTAPEVLRATLAGFAESDEGKWDRGEYEYGY
jgi:hypothetical protein